MSNEELLDVVEEQIPDFPALLEHEALYEIEDNCQSSTHGQHRRFLLAILTMSSDKLYEACVESPATYFEIFEITATTVYNIQDLARMVKAAHFRLMIGLCGVDTEAENAPFTKKDFMTAIDEATYPAEN